MAIDYLSLTVRVRWWAVPLIRLVADFAVLMVMLGFPPEQCASAFERIAFKMLKRAMYLEVS